MGGEGPQRCVKGRKKNHREMRRIDIKIESRYIYIDLFRLANNTMRVLLLFYV